MLSLREMFAASLSGTDVKCHKCHVMFIVELSHFMQRKLKGNSSGVNNYVGMQKKNWLRYALMWKITNAKKKKLICLHGLFWTAMTLGLKTMQLGVDSCSTFEWCIGVITALEIYGQLFHNLKS